MCIRSIYPIFLAAVFLLTQCKPENKAGPALPKKEEDVSAFVPNPVVVAEVEVKTLKPGSKAPDFRLPGTDGAFHSLNDYKDAQVLVIVFTCNHCPTAQAYEERIKRIATDYKQKGVQLLAISPNSPLGLLYEELGYSDLGDTYEDMVIRAEDKNFNFPYLYDGDTQEVTLNYGPVATPHVFVFDKERILKYTGRIDGSEKPGTAKGEDLRNAIEDVLQGQSPAEPVTKTFGCSTKWGWKIEMRKKIDRAWAAKKVVLTEADTGEIRELFKNPGTKLRLINIWATWCGPCRLEYPEFVILQRMYGARDFEFVSISVDDVSKKNKVLEFLEKAESALPNYIAATTDKYELIEAVDPKWNGALPYTVLLEPGGKVVWRQQGEADFLDLKKTIVEHPMIGRVY